MSKHETFIETSNTIDLFSDRFNKNVGTRQKDMWTAVFKSIKNLDTDALGNILPNRNNLRTLRNLRGEISKMIITPQYKKDLSAFLGGFNELKGINDTYYKAIASGVLNENKEIFSVVKELSIDATKNSLLEAGINNEIIAPVERILTQNITTGGSLQDLSEVLRSQILGNKDNLGALERYTKQITTDSLNQFNANYNATVSADLGLEFYYYAGSIKDTSRKYCVDRVNEGRYFHKKEVEQTSTEQWGGKIPGTNASNIIIYRGGYNCRHQWLAVSAYSAPKSVVLRNALNGNTIDTGGQDTLSINTVNGELTDKRKTLHNSIINKFEKGVTPVSNSKKTVYMTGGAPANGKSTLLESGRISLPKNSVLIDSDAIKRELQEFKKMSKDKSPIAASFTHEESSLLSKQLLNRSVQKDFNTVFDGTGNGSLESLTKKVNLMKSNGHRVSADYVTLDTDLSLKLADMRFKKTGRLVPPEYIKEVNQTIPRILPTAIKNGLFDDLRLWDTNINGVPRLVAEYKEGVFTILDKPLWKRFIDKGK